MKRIDEWLQTPPETRWERSLLNGLAVASRVYTAGVRARNWAYRSGVLRRTSLDIPVVSVGNITVGGTGKTPLAQFVARYFQSTGFRPVIVSRGYRKNSARLNVVSDGERVLLSARKAGDEPYLLARTLPGVPVIVGRNRAVSACVAVGRFAADVVIMDDAFQHLKVARNLDIVLVDAANPLGNGKTLPGGTLREPLTDLARAGAIVLTRVDQADGLNDLEQRLRSINQGAPIVHAVHVPEKLAVHPTEAPLDLAALRGARVLAVSSIGNPAAFTGTLSSLGAIPLDHLRFPNHAKYRKRSLLKISSLADSLKCDAVVTTEKDMVRLPAHIGCACPVWVLSVRFAILRGEEDLLVKLDALTGHGRETTTL